MAFLQIDFFSKALDVASAVNVIMPERQGGIGIAGAGEAGKPDVLYLLHGYSDDHTIWMRRTSVERYAAQHNLCVIMPAVNHSFYCNEQYGENYWDYVSSELPQVMGHFLQITDDPMHTYVAGLSMGGYGALRLALAQPERFAAAASFSGAVDLVGILHELQGSRLTNRQRILGDVDSAKGSEVDLTWLMKQNAQAPRKPKLYLSCGMADSLFEQNKVILPMLKENGWDVTWYEEPGASHEWSFWDAQIKAFIDFIYKKA